MADIYKAKVDIDAGNGKKFPKGTAVQGFSDKDIKALLESDAIEKVATLSEQDAAQVADVEARAKASADELVKANEQIETLTKQVADAEARAKAAEEKAAAAERALTDANKAKK
jgi:uncharacterized protein involved in exopolysaccharide biosynthesis